MAGSHLTYRYVLLTALLAKATDVRINTLALQAGARLKGSYDARSLCHSVIVPNEKELMLNALGGSNEPFLNKPARFPQISLRNAVRQGSDKRMLVTLHSTLDAIKSSEDATTALCDAVYFAIQKKLRETTQLESAIGGLRGGRHGIASFLTDLISKSVHGETCVLACAGVFWLMQVTRGEKWSIEVHPANESGMSSNEVSDIDVKIGGKLMYTVEVKDKTFLDKDVDHAVGRVAKVGFHTLHFIEGPRSSLNGSDYGGIVSEAAKCGVELYVLNLESLIRTVVSFAPHDLTLRDFATVISEFAKEARVNEETMQHLKSISESEED